MKSLIDLGRKEGPTETALWNTLQIQLSQERVGKENKYGIKKIIKKNKKPEKKCKKGSVQAGISKKLWALKVNEMLFIWMDHIINRHNPLLTLWRGAYESFPLLWLSIQGLTLFTYPVYSVDRFSEPPNSSRCAYGSGVSSCTSINSGWGGKCYISPCFSLLICGCGPCYLSFSMR